MCNQCIYAAVSFTKLKVNVAAVQSATVSGRKRMAHDCVVRGHGTGGDCWANTRTGLESGVGLNALDHSRHARLNRPCECTSRTSLPSTLLNYMRKLVRQQTPSGRRLAGCLSRTKNDVMADRIRQCLYLTSRFDGGVVRM